MKLILLPEYNIIVTDKKEQVQLGNLYYESDNHIPVYSFTKDTLPEQYSLQRVIASDNPQHTTCNGIRREGESCTKNNNCKYPDCKLPSIDYNSSKEKLGIPDVEKLAKGWAEMQLNRKVDIYPMLGANVAEYVSYIKGFKTSESLNENKFSLEEIFAILDAHTDAAPISYLKREFQKHHSRLKTFNVEVEMELVGECNGNNNGGCFMDSSGHDCGCYKQQPKISNGKIKINKVV
jgi:hypothetical protein